MIKYYMQKTIRTELKKINDCSLKNAIKNQKCKKVKMKGKKKE